MRQAIVTVLLLGMLAGLVAILILRERTPAPPAPDEPATEPAPSEPARPSATPAEKTATPTPTPTPVPVPGDTPAGKARPPAEKTMDIDRPVRAIAVGWDLLVPGLIANGGIKPGAASVFVEHGVQAQFRAAETIDDVESALALGGTDDNGADIAIVSLPRLVASYEDLRALRPQMFFIIGWSRGRHAIAGTQSKGLIELPAKGGGPSLVGGRGDAETLLALFLLDLAGVNLEQVKIVSRGDSEAETASFAAIDRAADSPPAKQSHVLATTADATSLIPYVAIAPQGFLENHPEAVNAWTKAWLAGVDAISRDVPAAARKVASQKGAPEPRLLLKQLGQAEFASLTDNARYLGLSGRGAVSLEALFARTWELWRRSGVLSTPAPEAAPLATGAVTSLVLTKKKLSEPEKPPKPSFAAAPILRVAVKTKDVDETELVRMVGFVAGVFGGSAIRVGVDRSKPRTEAILAQVSERYDLPTVRFRAEPGESKKGAASINILAAP